MNNDRRSDSVLHPPRPSTKSSSEGLTGVLSRAERTFITLNRGLIVGLIAVMFVLVFVNVVARYLFGVSFSWAEEVSTYLLVWLTYVGAGLAMREGRHVAVTMIERVLPDRVARWVRLAASLVILAFVGLMAVVGFRYAEFAWLQRTAVLRWPLGAVYLGVPIGMVVFLLHFVGVSAEYVRGGLQDTEALSDDQGAGEGNGSSTSA